MICFYNVFGWHDVITININRVFLFLCQSSHNACLTDSFGDLYFSRFFMLTFVLDLCLWLHNTSQRKQQNKRRRAEKGTFVTDILTCDSKKSAGFTDDINDGSVLLKSPSNPCHWITYSISARKVTQPQSLLLFTPVLFLMWNMKMSSVKKVIV